MHPASGRTFSKASTISFTSPWSPETVAALPAQVQQLLEEFPSLLRSRLREQEEEAVVVDSFPPNNQAQPLPPSTGVRIRISVMQIRIQIFTSMRIRIRPVPKGCGYASIICGSGSKFLLLYGSLSCFLLKCGSVSCFFLYAGPDPAFHFNADPDPAFHFRSTSQHLQWIHMYSNMLYGQKFGIGIWISVKFDRHFFP